MDEEEGVSRGRDDDEGTETEVDRPGREGVAPLSPRAPDMMMEGGSPCRSKKETPLTADTYTTAQQRRRDPTVPNNKRRKTKTTTPQKRGVCTTLTGSEEGKRKHARSANTSGEFVSAREVW